MLTQDYLVKMFSDFVMSIMRAIQREKEEENPAAAAELLEAAIGEAVNLDGAAFLSLAPSSIAQIMQVTGTDPKVTEYIARSMVLASSYHSKSGNDELAKLRLGQAIEIANAYGHDLNLESDDPKEIVNYEKVMEGFVASEKEEHGF